MLLVVVVVDKGREKWTPQIYAVKSRLQTRNRPKGLPLVFDFPSVEFHNFRFRLAKFSIENKDSSICSFLEERPFLRFEGGLQHP